jgi:hypothetical protein
VAGVVWFTIQRSIAESHQHASGTQRRKLDATDVMKALIMYWQVRTCREVRDITCAMTCHLYLRTQDQCILAILQVMTHK